MGTRCWLRRGVAAALVLAAAQVGGSPARAQSALELATVVDSGLEAPVFATHAGDGGSRLFVVERAGRVRIVRGTTLASGAFLDIGGRVLAGGERGLLGLAFHPAYETNGRFFVNYTRKPDGATVIAEFRVSSTDPDVARAGSERVLLVVPQPFDNHNGGMIAFDRAGLFHIGLGDGGGSGDPRNRAQNPQELLGKFLRIDVDRGDPYAIPSDNPFAGGGGRREIFALGFRNPFRFSFDRGGTGELYAGDVGQGEEEEIDIVRRGRNYGWRITEGRDCYRPPTGCDRSGLTAPLIAYGHTGGRCSVTGGYVYRGRAIPALVGTYLYADFCTGEIFRRRPDGRTAVLFDTGLNISSFGEDAAGEILVVGLGGTVHRLVRRG